MKIINITKLTGKYKIELENGKNLYVSEDTILKYGLIKKIDLSEKQIKDILKEESIERAYSKVIYYLKYGHRTEKEIIEYLNKKEIAPKIIEEVIGRLKDIGYINDDIYIEYAITDYFNLNKKGPYWIKRKLQQKELEIEKIEKTIKKICTKERQIDTLYEIIDREYRVLRESKNKKIQKITNKLYTNGYSFDIIKTSFDIFFEGYEESEEENHIIAEKFNKIYNSLKNNYEEENVLKRKITEKMVRNGFSYYDVKDYIDTINFKEL